MDGGKGKRRQNSLDDILGNLLSEDTQTKPAQSNSSKGKKGLKDDDFYSTLAAVAGEDPDSDISEADVDQVAKSIADLDDMDADLFGGPGPSKRNSVKSRSGKPTTPRRSSNTPRSRSGTPRSGKQGSPRRAPGSPTRGEGSPRGSIKRPPPKPSSPSPPSSDYKPGTAPGKMTDLGKESENLRPGQTFKTDAERPQTVPRAKPKIDYGEFNEDDPLAGLLSDEDDSIMETKKTPSYKKTLDKRSSSDDIFSSSETKIASPVPNKAPEETTPSLYDRPPTRSGAGTVTPEAKPEDVIAKPVPKRREERLFSDDDSMLDGLGIDEKPKTPVKTEVKDEDVSRPARSALDSLLGKDSVNKHLQKAERKEFILDTKKFSQKDDDSDEDLVFGEYKPSSIGGGSRPTSRRSVRFQDDDIFGTDDKPPSRGRPDSAKSSKAPDDMDWLELASGNRASIDVKNTPKPSETKSVSKSDSFDWLGLKDSSDEDKEVNQSETKAEKKTLSRHEDNDDWLNKLKAMNHGEDEVDAPPVKEKTTPPVLRNEPKLNEISNLPDKNDYLGLGKEIDFDDILTKKPESPTFPGQKSISDRKDIFDGPPSNDSVDASMRRRRLLLDDNDDDIFPPIESKPLSQPEDPFPSSPRNQLSTQLADLQQLDENPYFKKKVQKPPSTSESPPQIQPAPETQRVIQSTVYPSRVPNAVRNIITPPSTGGSYNTPAQPSYQQQQHYNQQPVYQSITQPSVVPSAYSNGQIILPHSLHEAHAMIQKLGVEKQYVESLLDSTRKRYEDEIKAVETSFRNRMKILEESNQKKEARLREETEELMEKHLSRVRQMEEEKSELANDNYRKLEELEREKAKSLEMLKEQQRLSLSELKREHVESIERLKEAKNLEINAVANANDTSKSLTAVVEQIQTSAKDIGSLHTQVESIHRNGLDEREISLKAKDQQLQNLQERLSRQEEDNEKERKRLEDLVSRMETQMKEQTRLLDEERWKMKSESARLEANQRSLEEEKRVWLEQQNRERLALERARDNFQEEQRSSLSQLNTERRNLAEERMKWNVDLKLHREQSHQEAIKMAQAEAEYEVLTKTIAEEKTRSAARKLELQNVEERLANEKARIDREKANLETEKENLSSRALQLKSKITEIDSMTEMANRTQSEGDRSLMEARNLESQHNQRLNNIQHELQKLKNMESNIAQEKLKISKERQELEKLRNSSLCVNCRSPMNGGLVNGTVAIPNGQPMMNSPNNMMSTPLPGVYGNKYSSPIYNGTGGQLSVNAIESITASIAHDRSIRMWKIQALKDKDYLEEESMFLETLKHSPYHSSH